jgi:Ca-activated chloride channel family protein
MAMALSDTEKTFTLKDLQANKVQKILKDIQKSVRFYSDSTGYLGDSMGVRGPRGLSAAIVYESVVIDLNSREEVKKGTQPRVQAIYPIDGTFYSDHPVGIVQREWVTQDQKDAAEKYISFLLEKEQQERAAFFGFRPGDPKIKVEGGKFTKEFGVDPAKPDQKHVREAPDANVVEEIIKIWEKERKGTQIVLALDISLSMNDFNKIERAKEWAQSLIQGLGDKNSLTLMTFNHRLETVQELVALTEENKKALCKAIDGLNPRGGTRLYDAIDAAYEKLQNAHDTEEAGAIQMILLLSDGCDTRSEMQVEKLLNHLKAGGTAPVIFSVAYDIPGMKGRPKPGDPDRPDMDFLEELARITGGQVFQADPVNIKKALTAINSLSGSRSAKAK